jgi:hypothetical protein
MLIVLGHGFPQVPRQGSPKKLHLEKLQHVVGRVVGPLPCRILQQSHMSEPMSVGMWFQGLVVVGHVTFLYGHHEVGDPGQQFSGGFVWTHG